MFYLKRVLRPVSTAIVAAVLLGTGPCGGGAGGGDNPAAPLNDVASVQIIATPTNPRVGETSLVSATPVNAGGIRVQGVACTYTSSTPAVAAAIQSGDNANVTGIVAGNTTITATCAGKNNSVIITVRPPVVTLTLTTLGSGNGTLFASPAVGLGYDAGTVVTVTEFPTSGSAFTGWGGACNGVAACVVTLTANATVTGAFDARYNLTISNAGTGTGTVTANPPGLSYAPNTSVTLTAVPSANSVFGGWSGVCAGTSNCLITMDANKAATATFTGVAPVADAVTPGAVTLGSAGSCTGGTLTTTFHVAAASNITWTAAGDSPNYQPLGGGTFGIAPGSGSGSRDVVVTITVPPQLPSSSFSNCGLTYSLGTFSNLWVTFSDGAIIGVTAYWTFVGTT